MSGRPVGPWLFGKLPAHGDFVARGLDPQRRDAVDVWLSRELDRARAENDADFDARFDAAPPCRFVDRDADGAMSGGVLCASVDAVGRRYPLIVARPVATPGEARAAAAACEALVYAAFADGLDADAVAAAAALPLAADRDGDGDGVSGDGACWWLADDSDAARDLVVGEGRYPDGVVARVLAAAA